jgi:2-phospho-L-lactate transferase/gluconeogenesis factor (CofD/UPF0052 family)
MDTIKILEFLSGEKVIATVTNTNNDWHTVKNAMAIIPGGKPNTIGFGPWPVFADHNSKPEHMVNSRSLTLEPYAPHSEMVQNYVRMNSGLILPPSSPVTSAGPKLILE